MPRQKSQEEVGETIGSHLAKADGRVLTLDRVTIVRSGNHARVSVPDATPEQKPMPEALSESASA